MSDTDFRISPLSAHELHYEFYHFLLSNRDGRLQDGVRV